MSPADRIRQLAVLLEGTGIGLLELTTLDGVFRMQRDADAVEAATPVAQVAPITVPAPSVGVFRAAHPMQETPLAGPGQRVAAGEAVGLIEVGALLLHVLAPADGVVLDVLARDDDVVGYGAPLMRLMEAQ